jgi:hypothetical protein
MQELFFQAIIRGVDNEESNTELMAETAYAPLDLGG